MGGQLIKGYSIEGESLCQAGLCKSWKLYKGHNSSTHVSASIFLIQKKQFKKNDREELIKLAKKQSTNLLRVRHPGVLAVIEPLVQDQNVLAYVSEKIEGNISLLIKQNRLQQFITSELELKLFLYPFVETLTFIHDTLKQAHLAISFDSIFITADGKWKLAGFGHNQQTTSQQLASFDQKNTDLSFSAPEIALQQSYSKKSDVFSLGLVILRLLQFIHKSYKPISPIQDKNEYERQMKDIKNLSAHPLMAKSENSTQLLQFLRPLLSWSPNQRCKQSDILYSSWMNDSTLMTVKYLDKISNYESKQQLDFLKGLAGVLDDFPLRVTNRLVIPKLIDLLKYNHLIASIVYIVIDLLKKNRIEDQSFKKAVWPSLKSVTQGKQMTAQAIYLLVLNIEVFEKVVSEADVGSHLLPLYIKCFDCPPKLKQLALSMLEKISKKVDYQFLKTKIIPKIINLLKDGSIEIRKDALKGLNTIVHLIDNQTVTLTVLPGLEAARKAGSDPFVNAIITHIHKKLGETLPVQVLSTKILPTLIPYLTEPSINRGEFLQFKSLIIQMIERIERQSSKQFDSNALSTLQSNYTEFDFKFKESDIKAPETKKGDYNFLSSYLQPKQETSITPKASEIKPSFDIPVVNANTFMPVVSMTATTKTQAPVYNFDSLSSGFPSSFLSSNVQIGMSQPRKAEEIKIETQSPFMNTDIFENMPKKEERYQSKPQQSRVGQDLPFQSYQNKKTSSQYTPPSPPKEEGQKKKFIGGASGPMEIKKLKGPLGPGSKNQKPTLTPQSIKTAEIKPPKKEESNIFTMNFENYNSFGMDFNQPTAKKDQQPLTSGYNFGSTNMYSNVSSSSNPFEEIEGPQSNFDAFTPNITPASKPQQNQSGDIYSYFSSQSYSGPQAKPKSNFQLI